MKVLLDACVLYPTVMREILLAVAGRGAFTPFWSARILEEWARAARKIGDSGEAQARGEIALIRAAWPAAEVDWPVEQEAQLWLPDPADRHVLAAAIAARVDLIVTMNLSDFPVRALAEHGLTREHPDGFLHGIWLARPELVAEAAEDVRAEAERLSGHAWEVRKLLKKARMPRLGKALAES